MSVNDSSRQARGKLLTVAEAAERLNVKERTIRSLLFDRRLPRIKVGRQVRIAETDIETFIEAQRIEAAS